MVKACRSYQHKKTNKVVRFQIQQSDNVLKCKVDMWKQKTNTEVSFRPSNLSRWYAKRFLHPDVVAAYDYIFIWDEDLGVEHFNGDKYILFLFCE